MGGPVAVAEAADAVVSALVDALAVVSGPGSSPGTVAEWAAALGALQRVVDVACAAQEVTIARLAALEVEPAGDGTLVERRRGPGHVSLDAAPVVAGALACTGVHAERRVRSAVARAADGPPGSPAASGLGGLHAAMVQGRLDVYRADVVAAELEGAPAQVAASVVAALEPYLADETGTQLRRRCRRLLARVSPDLLRQRARRARCESRLERWATEPGVDTWHGTFPSEEAALAWAAVDALAQRYVADGTCATVDRARAKALTDLVTGNATITTDVVLTVPATAAAGHRRPTTPAGRGAPATAGAGGTGEQHRAHPQDLVEVPGLRPSEPLLVPRAWLGSLTRTARDAAAAPAASRRDRRRLCVRACHEHTGAALTDLPDLPEGPGSPERPPGPGPYRPPRHLADLVRARDGHCRFPGCHVAARFCDLDHVRPWPAGPTTADNLACLCRRHHRTKQRPGWRVTAHPDGTLTWTDPTGRARTTDPLDTLHPLVLPHRPDEPTPTPHTPRLHLPDAPHSTLEHTLEHLTATPPRIHVRYQHPPHHRARASPPPQPPPF